MKRVLAAIILGAGFAAAHAQTALIDGFNENNHYVLPFDPSYATNNVAINSPTLFQLQSLSGSNYSAPHHRHGFDGFTEHSGGGFMHAEGHDHSAGEVDLTYSNPGYAPTDITGYGSMIVDVLQATRPVDVAWGFFSGGFNETSGSAVFNAPGIYTLNFTDLQPGLDPTSVNSMFLDMSVRHGGQLTLGSVSLGQAVATPEPAPFVGMGLGVGLLALRRRKKA